MRTHGLAYSHGITKTWSAALVGICTNSPGVMRRELMPLCMDHGVPKTLLVALWSSEVKGLKAVSLGMPQWRGVSQMLAETLSDI